jgi:hypothetical protein
MTNGSITAPKAGERYVQKEVDLILSLVPTDTNAERLAAALGRNVDAVRFIYIIAYDEKLLRDGLTPNGNNVYHKIARAKKKLGIFIGYRP